MLGSAVAGSCISAYLAVHTTDVVLEHADAAELEPVLSAPAPNLCFHCGSRSRSGCRMR